MQKEEITNSEGQASIHVLANDKDTVKISAVVAGNGLSSASISKSAQILNIPVETEIVEQSPTDEGFSLDTNMMILIAIPVGIGASLVMLKRMDKLDLITEKIPIGDKIEEIKERISDIRDR